MGINSYALNQEGDAMCVSCRKKTHVDKLELCAVCDRFVCSNCAKYRRQGNPYGWVCKKCALELKNDK